MIKYSIDKIEALKTDDGFVKNIIGVLKYKLSRLQNLGENPTLAEIGLCMGITRERVRQLEDAALKKIKMKVYDNEK